MEGTSGVFDNDKTVDGDRRGINLSLSILHYLVFCLDRSRVQRTTTVPPKKIFKVGSSFQKKKPNTAAQMNCVYSKRATILAGANLYAFIMEN